MTILPILLPGSQWEDLRPTSIRIDNEMNKISIDFQ